MKNTCSFLSERSFAHVGNVWDIFLYSFILRIYWQIGSFVLSHASPELPLLHIVSMAEIGNASCIGYCVPIQSHNPCPHRTPGTHWELMKALCWLWPAVSSAESGITDIIKKTSTLISWIVIIKLKKQDLSE